MLFYIYEPYNYIFFKDIWDKSITHWPTPRYETNQYHLVAIMWGILLGSAVPMPFFCLVWWPSILDSLSDNYGQLPWQRIGITLPLLRFTPMHWETELLILNPGMLESEGIRVGRNLTSMSIRVNLLVKNWGMRLALVGRPGQTHLNSGTFCR